MHYYYPRDSYIEIYNNLAFREEKRDFVFEAQSDTDAIECVNKKLREFNPHGNTPGCRFCSFDRLVRIDVEEKITPLPIERDNELNRYGGVKKPVNKEEGAFI